MPDLTWNRAKWDGHHHWSQDGDEWSGAWGDADIQWRGSLAPRLRPFLPARNIVEIAPGNGRWTAYLGQHCDSLIGVDLSQSCIDRCKDRFADQAHMQFHTGDGLSLPMVEDGWADLVFSFDSLVHVELDVLESYLDELARVLSPQGVAFLHHSNLGAYPGFFRAMKAVKARLAPGGGDASGGTGPSEGQRDPGARFQGLRHALWLDSDRSRGLSVTAERVEAAAGARGLKRVSQEVVNWGTRRTIDCISVLAKADAEWDDRGRYHNPGFMKEAAALRELASVYRPGGR